MNLNKIVSEFRGLDPKDMGSWPLVPKVATLVGAFSAILVAGWFALGQEVLDSITQEEANVEKLKGEYLEKKKLAVNLTLYKEQLAEIENSFGKLLRQLPSKSEVDNLLIEVNQSGLGRGLNFELFKPGADTVKEFYAELPVQIKVRGDYNALGFFTEDVAKLSRVITIGNVTMVADVPKETAAQKGKVVTPQAVLVNMEATLKTYRYLDEAEVAEQKRKQAEEQKAKKKGAK